MHKGHYRSNFMSLQLRNFCQLNPNPFCNIYYILSKDVNAVTTLFVVTGQNVIIITKRVMIKLTSVALL